MSSDVKDFMAFTGCLVAIVLVVGAVIWGIGWAWANTTEWFEDHPVITVNEDAAKWKSDPRNPAVAGQRCLDSGGYPKYSAWDGRFLDCRADGEGR